MCLLFQVPVVQGLDATTSSFHWPIPGVELETRGLQKIVIASSHINISLSHDLPEVAPLPAHLESTDCLILLLAFLHFRCPTL